MKKLILIKLFVLTGVSTSHAFCGTDDPQALGVKDSAVQKIIVDFREDKTYNLWSLEDRVNLSYCIADSFGEYKEKMIQVMDHAAQAWQETSGVRFIYKPEHDKNCDKSNSAVLFRVKVLNSRRSPITAKAFFPYADQDKRKVIFKKTLFRGASNRITLIAIHELGHVLGFRHEHMHPETKEKRCKEEGIVDYVTPYDQDSIMHYESCGGRWALGLSELDKYGVSLVYPKEV